MKEENIVRELLTAFFVATVCIDLLMGVVGVIFEPEIRFGYDAYFSPPFFGFCSALLGIVTHSVKELSVRQVIVRRGIHLLLIEFMVFGLNYYVNGIFFEPLLSFVLAFSIFVVFVLVYVIIWLNDRMSAAVFNSKLKEFQEKERRFD